MKKNFEYSSGNIFADLNLPNSDELLAKAELVRQIHVTIKKRKLTQKRAAELLHIDQPKISDLLGGKLNGFSLERLMRFLNDLGHDIIITVAPKVTRSKRGATEVGLLHQKTATNQDSFKKYLKK